MIQETSRNKDSKAQEHDQGIRVGRGWCSSRRVRGGGWVTMSSHDVEISIAGVVTKMVCAPTPTSFLFFFLVFFFISCALFYSSSRYKDYVQRELW